MDDARADQRRYQTSEDPGHGKRRSRRNSRLSMLSGESQHPDDDEAAYHEVVDPNRDVRTGYGEKSHFWVKGQYDQSDEEGRERGMNPGTLSGIRRAARPASD